MPLKSGNALIGGGGRKIRGGLEVHPSPGWNIEAMTGFAPAQRGSTSLVCQTSAFDYSVTPPIYF